MAKSSCAIAGASGLVGGHLLALLLREFDQVAAVTRRPLAISAPHLTEIGFESPLPPIESAFCTLGATLAAAGSRTAFRKVDFDLVLDFARRAQLAGASNFAVVSSVAADVRSPVPYLRIKGKMEEAVGKMGFQRVALLRPSFLIGDRAEPRKAERAGIAMAQALRFALVGPLRRYRAISAERVAAAMLQSGWDGVKVLEYDNF